MHAEADLNTLALSERIVDGKPLLIVNLRKHRRNDDVVKSLVISRWTTRVQAQVNIPSIAGHFIGYIVVQQNLSLCTVNGGPSLTLSPGRSGCTSEE